MNQEEARKRRDNWFQNHLCGIARIPLLKTKPDGVTPVRCPKTEDLVCSDQLLENIDRDRQRIQGDIGNPRSIEGMLYLVYRIDEQQAIEPIYIGIASALGRDGASINTVWNVRGARFSDARSSGGHVDKLSQSLSRHAHAYQSLRKYVRC